MEILIKRASKIRRELLEKAVKEYLERHPEEAKGVIKPAEQAAPVVQETHGPDWPGWRALSKGEHKKGDWVVGTKCSWNGTTSKYEEKVPACHEEIPPYQFKDKYQQNCCREHDLYVLMAYTLEQIRYCNNRKAYNPRAHWCSPLNVAQLAAVMVKLEDKTFDFKKTESNAEYINCVLSFLDNPVVKIKFPHIYGENVRAALAEWREIGPYLANMIVSDMVKRKITPDAIEWAYNISQEDVASLPAKASKRQ